MSFPLAALLIFCAIWILLCIYNLIVLAWVGPSLRKRDRLIAEAQAHLDEGRDGAFWECHRRIDAEKKEYDRRMSFIFPKFSRR